MLTRTNVEKTGIDSFSYVENKADKTKRMVIIEKDCFVAKMKNGFHITTGKAKVRAIVRKIKEGKIDLKIPGPIKYEIEEYDTKNDIIKIYLGLSGETGVKYKKMYENSTD